MFGTHLLNEGLLSLGIIEILKLKRIVLGGLFAPPDGLSIPSPHTLCPERLTCREYTSELLALAFSQWVQLVGGTSTGLGTGNRYVPPWRHRALSKFQCLLPPLVVTTCLGVLPPA